ncbi:UvrD-helicase domain-containing protein [Nocardioides alkalitolerans]|uniref:UvrD-helicase domain-containing protein n=1 Tax=Nocardioides alkalitolerans TaxID=281714 RepID=UPI00042801DB|nr:UvrD-helicase domain-containing protein [Nocardioides alkalitolerans]
MSARQITEFDVLASDLPTGTTLLEASAGTGKTWTIGALVARYVAEGRARLDEMLVVTFGRAASQELRQRVRGQLDDLADALRATLRALDEGTDPEVARGSDGTAPEGATPGADESAAPAPNEVVAMLCAGGRDELVARLARVDDALAHFDAATIATIHQFCQQVLRSLGVAGDTDPSARLVEDVDDLLDEVVDDLYLRGFVDDEKPSFTHAEARRLGRAAAYDPQATIVPEHPADGTPAARRVGFARAVRRELDRRKRRAGLLGYDDLLSQLAAALADHDAPARLRMRGRWKVVLVDEFQDTDPVQWQVFDRAFTGVEGITMVLIGDPKQAIYAFRGGDVVTYLAAAATASTHQTLATNWRSDAGLVGAVQRVLEGAALGDDQIVVRPVHAHHQRTRLTGAPSDAPFRLRVVRRDHVTSGGSGRQKLWTSTVRPYVEADCARDIARLLASDAQFDGRPLQAGDVAVIAHGRRQLGAVQTALRALGVRAVFAGGGSVYGTPAALEWLTLLEAVEAPYRSARVRAAALTSFFPYDVVGLVADSEAASDEVTDAVADTLRGWGDLLVRRGVAAVFEAAVRDGLFARVLAQEGGERHLTDLRHLAESLHQTARGEGRSTGESLGLVGLIAWLRDEMRDEGADGVSERTRRLDSDASAVQLVTIHGSKGLEYPVVYLPSLADRWVRDPDVPLFHLPPDAAGTRSRAVDVGGRSGPHWRDSVAAHVAEDAGESLRLLYVALTRARSQVVTWWAPTTTTPSSPLHRVLFGRRPGEADVPDPAELPSDADAAARLARWAEHGGPVVEEAVPTPLLPAPAPPAPAALAVRRFERRVDTAWRRTSYSSLAAGGSAAGHGAGRGTGSVADLGVTSEPEVEPKTDEVDGAGPGTPGDLPALADDVVSPMATLPVGATFGSLVHAVLEHADLTSPDLVGELRARVEEQRGWWPVDNLDADVLATALAAVATTPMGPLAGDRTLSSIATTDLLEELDFELPLAGGDDAPRGAAAEAAGVGVLLGDLGPLLRAHLPEGDPVRGYADALDADPALADQPLRGYLTGSVDVVLRLRGQGDDGGDRYLVVDYKTNWLGPYAGSGAGTDLATDPGSDEGTGAAPLLHASAYRPEALAAAMRGSDYPLQALLYAVVAHRFLRWRLASYDPERHLGGVLYLYLRGMCGPATPTVDGHPCGVFSWRPPVALVVAVSDLLDGEAPARGPGRPERKGRRP